tara:strand:- start:4036 stop:5184 length:1149 start_codon:yes stop_codon:yes gene_type:complete
MNLIFFLVNKFFKSIFKNKSSRLPALISLFSIFISIFSIMIVMFVMKGFEIKVQNKILENFPHIIFQSPKNENISKLNELKNILKIDKTVETYGAIIINNEFSIVKIKGKTEVEEINNKKNDSKLPVVILDRNLFFQNRTNTTIEIFIPAPNTLKKIRKIDVFVGGSSNNSCNVPCIFIDYKTSLNILNKSESFYEVLLKNPFNSDITIKEILSIKPELQGKIIDWKSLNSNLFNIMKLERFSLGIFLFFLILISSTTLYSNTVSMIFQKKSDIATLISLGATNKQVVLVFLITNLLIALCGYLLGVILVVLTTYLLINTNLIEILNINLTFYGIEGFPIIFSLEYFFYISFFSLLIIIFATYLPTKNYLGKNIRNLINRNN